MGRADIPRLADYFTRRFDLESGIDDDHRMAAAIEVMSQRGEIKAQYVSNHDHVATYCRRAAVSYERTFFDGQRWRTTGCCLPLFRSFEPNGFLRVFSADLDFPRDNPEPSEQGEDWEEERNPYDLDGR